MMTPYSDIRKKLIGATICCLSYNAGASDLRRMFAQHPLLQCHICYAIRLKTCADIFLDFTHLLI